MPHFFIILLKINLVLVLFAAAYYLILRRLTFYVINRIFLAFGILFSTIYPFINLTDFFHRQKQINQEVVAFVPKLNQKVNQLVPSNFITEHWQLISALFYIGVVLMAARLIIQFVSLYRMHQKSKPGSVANYNVRILEEPVSPFSFWQTVYINPQLHKEKELATILAHENIHVKEWHSLDIILAELSVVFYWFNPGVWLMKKAVKENLEFITDEKILKRGMDKKTYQYSLLDVGSLTPSVAIVNNFNLSDLKKRIQMMNVKRSSRLTLSRYLFVLPVLLLTTLAFTVSKKDIKAIKKHLKPLENVLVQTNIIDAPTVQTKETAKKHTTRRKKANQINIDVKADSIGNMVFTVNTIYIKTDTTKQVKDDGLLKAISKMAGTLTMEQNTLKGRIYGRFIHPDSVVSGAASGARVQNIKIVKGERLGNTGEPEDMKGVITVVGYGSKRTDSLKAVGSMNFIVNGKSITKDELSKINPNDIKDVKITKEPTDKLKEVIVLGRKNK